MMPITTRSILWVPNICSKLCFGIWAYVFPKLRSRSNNDVPCFVLNEVVCTHNTYLSKTGLSPSPEL